MEGERRSGSAASSVEGSPANTRRTTLGAGDAPAGRGSTVSSSPSSAATLRAATAAASPGRSRKATIGAPESPVLRGRTASGSPATVRRPTIGSTDAPTPSSPLSSRPRPIDAGDGKSPGTRAASELERKLAELDQMQESRVRRQTSIRFSRPEMLMPSEGAAASSLGTDTAPARSEPSDSDISSRTSTVARPPAISTDAVGAPAAATTSGEPATKGARHPCGATGGPGSLAATTGPPPMPAMDRKPLRAAPKTPTPTGSGPKSTTTRTSPIASTTPPADATFSDGRRGSADEINDEVDDVEVAQNADKENVEKLTTLDRVALDVKVTSTQAPSSTSWDDPASSRHIPAPIASGPSEPERPRSSPALSPSASADQAALSRLKKKANRSSLMYDVSVRSKAEFFDLKSREIAESASSSRQRKVSQRTPATPIGSRTRASAVAGSAMGGADDGEEKAAADVGGGRSQAIVESPDSEADGRSGLGTLHDGQSFAITAAPGEPSNAVSGRELLSEEAVSQGGSMRKGAVLYIHHGGGAYFFPPTNDKDQLTKSSPSPMQLETPAQAPVTPESIAEFIPMHPKDLSISHLVPHRLSATSDPQPPQQPLLSGISMGSDTSVSKEVDHATPIKSTAVMHGLEVAEIGETNQAIPDEVIAAIHETERQMQRGTEADVKIRDDMDIGEMDKSAVEQGAKMDGEVHEDPDGDSPEVPPSDAGQEAEPARPKHLSLRMITSRHGPVEDADADDDLVSPLPRQTPLRFSTDESLTTQETYRTHHTHQTRRSYRPPSSELSNLTPSLMAASSSPELYTADGSGGGGSYSA
ncbi:hypothetical protein BDK51DRAFT_30201, partial [Blyttiomyces helicus]